MESQLPYWEGSTAGQDLEGLQPAVMLLVSDLQLSPGQRLGAAQGIATQAEA